MGALGSRSRRIAALTSRSFEPSHRMCEIDPQATSDCMPGSGRTSCCRLGRQRSLARAWIHLTAAHAQGLTSATPSRCELAPAGARVRRYRRHWCDRRTAPWPRPADAPRGRQVGHPSHGAGPEPSRRRGGAFGRSSGSWSYGRGRSSSAQLVWGSCPVVGRRAFDESGAASAIQSPRPYGDPFPDWLRGDHRSLPDHSAAACASPDSGGVRTCRMGRHQCRGPMGAGKMMLTKQAVGLRAR
jgi:hypothetical protein